MKIIIFTRLVEEKDFGHQIVTIFQTPTSKSPESVYIKVIRISNTYLKHLPQNLP